MEKIIKITEVKTSGHFEATVSVDGKIESLLLVYLDKYYDHPEKATFEDMTKTGICNVIEMLQLVHEYAKKGYDLKIKKLEVKYIDVED